ncbi:MAG: hypothetical protein JWQ69_5942 [Pseudomonas sp.]|nr:hypothetical protein [Pseudomonas sp.]
MSTEKEALEFNLLRAQMDKTLAEVNVLRRTTPVVESVKILSSMILGVGGVLAALTGYQFAEVKVKMADMEMAGIQAARDKLSEEVVSLDKKKLDLSKENQALQENNRRLNSSLADTKTVVDQVMDKLSTPALAENPQLDGVRQDLNATGIDLRTTSPLPQDSNQTTDMSALIQGLFSPQAATRGQSYEQLMSQYSSSPELAPALLYYAGSHGDNTNGIYNTLVVLSHIDRNSLRKDSAAIRIFAETARGVGPKTSERVDKLLTRLPNG